MSFAPMVHHTPDNIVVVHSTDKEYIDTLANFQADFATTMPALPAGADDRVYEPGIRHPIMGSGNVIDGGPVPWTLGDGWITNIQAGLDAQAARQPPLVP
jgi:hypothetical protein